MKTIARFLARALIVATFGVLVLVGSGRLGLQAAPAARWPARVQVRSTPRAQSSAFLQSDEGPGEAHKELFEWINFLILIGVLVYVLRRPFADFFADRLDTIREGLEEGRKAIAASEAKLGEIERKLANVQEEIAAFRAESEREMQAERERAKQAAEREGERIVAFAGVQIQAAVRAAKLDLKRYAAGRAVELAETMIRQRLDEPTRRGLVSGFVADLKSSGRHN